MLVRQPVKSAAYRVFVNGQSVSWMPERLAYHDAHKIELFELVVAPLFGEAVAIMLLGTVEQVEYGTLA